MSRRDVLVAGGLLAATAGRPGIGQTAAGLSFAPMQGSAADTVIVPGGYRAGVVLRWGDPLLAGAAGPDIAGLAEGSLFRPGAAAAQAAAFGQDCDGMAVFGPGPDRIVACVNHEAPEPATMFPGWVGAGRDGRGPLMAANPEAVAVMQASVGVSVVELQNAGGAWRAIRGAPLNRRVTAESPVVFTGPAAGHPWIAAGSGGAPAGRGTFGNCAAGATPWGTYLTAEENVDQFFGRGAEAGFDEQSAAAHRRFGFRRGDSAYRWEYADGRFDLSRNPNEPFRFGWIVEIDPRRPQAPPRKRTALGRMKHEGATTVLAADGRPVVYMGDDEVFEYLYKFVAAGAVNPDGGNDDLLDSGTLYVARMAADGTGEWLPLVRGGHGALTAAAGFADQGDIVMRCREAADAVGATPLDRPEDIAVDPLTGRIYLSCTQNPGRGTDVRTRGSVATATDGPNPRPRNEFGHILEFTEDGDDFAATTFRWDVFVLAGDPAAGDLRAALDPRRPLGRDTTYYGGQADPAGLSAFANPDNLTFDANGNLWIVTDGTQPRDRNNGCFVCPASGPDRGAVRQFMSGPVGAEICGCVFSPDGQTLFLNVQHPGSGGSVERPISDWPDGGGAPPRSGLVAVTTTDLSRSFGA